MANIRSANGATTLPGKYYTSHNIFSEELSRIFYESWLCVGHRSRLQEPGSYFIHQVGSESVLILMDESRTIRAFYNVCRHRGTRICTEAGGKFEGGIQCPYHAWTYDLTGRLIGAPNMHGVQNFELSNFPLHTVPMVESEGLIFVNFSAAPSEFAAVFHVLQDRFKAWGIEDLQSIQTVTYDVRANWKLIFQNYSECYHCPKVHPTLARLTPYNRSTNHFEEGAVLGGPMEMKGQSMTTNGGNCAPPIRGLTGADLKSVHYYSMFPSLFVTLHPDYVLLHRIEPQNPEHTRIVCDWLFHPEAIHTPNFNPDPAVEFWDVTNRQDWHVCELSQQGVSSRAYTPGPYADLESLLAAFDRQYLRTMGEDHSSQLAS